MAQSAANLVDHVLPIVPLRQFVVTFPFELRARLAYDGKLLAATARVAIDSVLGFYNLARFDCGNNYCIRVELALRCFLTGWHRRAIVWVNTASAPSSSWHG